MSDHRTTGNAGQNTEPSIKSPSTPSDILEEIATMARDIEELLPRVRAAAERMARKLRTEEEDSAPQTEPVPSHVEPNGEDEDAGPYLDSPPFALLSDGTLLMSVEHAADRDLAGRRIWRGFEIRSAEGIIVAEGAEHALFESAAELAAKLPKLSGRS